MYRTFFRENANVMVTLLPVTAKNTVTSPNSWCGNFAETVSFHKISTPENQVKLRYFSQCVQKQQDGHNCSLFTVTFAAEILDGKSPVDAVFYAPQLRNHLIYCIESRVLTPFPKI